MDIAFLNFVELWDSLRKMIEAVGWTDFLRFTFPIYERLCWEFLSSLVVNWNTRYQDHPIYIKFRFFNRDFVANLHEFDQHLRLPHGGVWIVGHVNFNVQSFWCEITHEKRTKVLDNHGSQVAYSSSGSKGASICNPTLRYLHCLIANTIFTRYKSQSCGRLSEVFLIWCILKDERFDTGAFILHQLVSQATLPKSPIACGGLVTAIAHAWGLEPQLKQMTPLF